MSMAQKNHIGLTGSIGAGKSTVSERFRQLGALVLDADAISRSALERGFRVVEEREEGSFPNPRISYSSRAVAGCDLCSSCGGGPRCAIACPTGALSFE